MGATQLVLKFVIELEGTQVMDSTLGKWDRRKTNCNFMEDGEVSPQDQLHTKWDAVDGPTPADSGPIVCEINFINSGKEVSPDSQLHKLWKPEWYGWVCDLWARGSVGI